MKIITSLEPKPLPKINWVNINEFRKFARQIYFFINHENIQYFALSDANQSYG